MGWQKVAQRIREERLKQRLTQEMRKTPLAMYTMYAMLAVFFYFFIKIFY